MVMTSEGLNRIRNLISTDITHGTMGTDGTTPTINDTDLIAEDATTEETVTATTTDRQVQFSYELVSTDGTTSTYREFKLNSAATDFDRIVFTGISWTKNGAENISITKKYFFRGT